MDDFDFELDNDAVAKGDKNADRITDSGAYIGKFTSVAYLENEDTGSRGLEFEFESVTGGQASFTVYTHSKKTGELKTTFGYDQVQALMYLLGVKTLKRVPGIINGWVGDEGARTRGEVEGFHFPELENKPIGIVLQKELTTKKTGSGDSHRWNLYGQFDPVSKLTASELRDRKTRPEKFDKLMKGLKDKDSRKSRGGESEPSQPGMGMDLGGL